MWKTKFLKLHTHINKIGKLLLYSPYAHINIRGKYSLVLYWYWYKQNNIFSIILASCFWWLMKFWTKFVFQLDPIVHFPKRKTWPEACSSLDRLRKNSYRPQFCDFLWLSHVSYFRYEENVWIQFHWRIKSLRDRVSITILYFPNLRYLKWTCFQIFEGQSNSSGFRESSPSPQTFAMTAVLGAALNGVELHEVIRRFGIKVSWKFKLSKPKTKKWPTYKILIVRTLQSPKIINS